ncbi:TasA family protein [Brevibacillus reuszeri]|uniref:TasA family protein n=1 Tax=Brevibacillus reuszeri TaxID=54915 RepID=UPI002897489D|nr:TasA family protein [Brevibacillus reuszeri]
MGLGNVLVSGATYLAFTDTESVTNTFATGRLGFMLQDKADVTISDLKPGDEIVRTFTLTNTGTLGIDNILIHTDYHVVDAKGNNGTKDMGDHLIIELSKKDGQKLLLRDTLANLKSMTKHNQSVSILLHDENHVQLPSGDNEMFAVKIRFHDNGQDQNVFQGDKLTLSWRFEALQGRGSAH